MTIRQEQRALFDPHVSMTEGDRAKRAALMEAVDAANRQFGRRAVAFAAMGSPVTLKRTRDGSEGAPVWETRWEAMSPR